MTTVLDSQDRSDTALCAEIEGSAVCRTSYCVLVIDDDVTFQQCVSSLLRENGFIVLTAPSGIRGLDMLSSGPCGVRVVLLDYKLPDLDGTNTLQYLRKLHPAIKVIAVTGSMPQSVTGGFREGVDHYIEKPINTRELVETIDSLAGSSR